MASSRDKYWDFTVDSAALTSTLVPVIERTFTTDGEERIEVPPDRHGIAPEAVPGAVPDRVRRNDWRAEALSRFIAEQCNAGGVDFLHDPDHGEEPDIDTVGLTKALGRMLGGVYDRAAEDLAKSMRAVSRTLGDERGTPEPHPATYLAPLFDDEFTPPTRTRAFVTAVVDAVAKAVADGIIPVDAEEPYDSCAHCGGYHNVNYDCGGDADDPDDGQEDDA